VFVLINDFSWEMNSSLSTKERNKIRIFKFFFKIWKIKVIKRVDNIRESVNSWLTPIFVEKKDNIKLFYE